MWFCPWCSCHSVCGVALGSIGCVHCVIAPPLYEMLIAFWWRELSMFTQKSLPMKLLSVLSPLMASTSVTVSASALTSDVPPQDVHGANHTLRARATNR